MKYEIKEIGLDDYELHYKDKEGKDVVIPFKRTVDLAVKIQNIDARSRFKMLNYLTSIGKSKEDLIVERKQPDGKIIRDETNYREFEASFLLQEQFTIALEIYEDLFKKDFVELISEMGLNEKEAAEFGTEIREILINGKVKKIPSEESQTK